MGWGSLFKAGTKTPQTTVYGIRADGQMVSHAFSSLAAAEVYADGLVKSGHQAVDIIDRASGRRIKKVRASAVIVLAGLAIAATPALADTYGDPKAVYDAAARSSGAYALPDEQNLARGQCLSKAAAGRNTRRKRSGDRVAVRYRTWKNRHAMLGVGKLK